MTTRAEDQAAEIARLAEALVARTEELAETMEEVLSGEKPGREPAVQTL